MTVDEAFKRICAISDLDKEMQIALRNGLEKCTDEQRQKYVEVLESIHKKSKELLKKAEELRTKRKNND